VIAAQNEIGTIQPVADIGRLCKERGILFHTDAVQAAGRIDLDVEAMGIDLLSLSAHKVYGPKGVGALYVRRKNPRVRLQPLLYGGDQERGWRPGTLNVPGIAAMGEACRLARAEMVAERTRLEGLRDRLLGRLETELTGVVLNGARAGRLAGNLNLSFGGVRAHSLLGALTVLAVSSSSACTRTDSGPSAILTSLGVPDDLARASLRIGLGRFTTTAEVDFAAATIIAAVTKLRAS
jgi:cysteine desulfurase